MKNTTETASKKSPKKSAKKNPQKNLRKFKIFRVETDEKTKREKRITMMTFSVENEKEAYEELKRYRKIANKQYTYYYGRVGGWSCMDVNGNKKVYFDSFDEMSNYMLHRKRGFFRGIGRFFGCLKDGISNKFYTIRHGLQRMFIGHSEMEACGILDHLLDDLEFNLPILSKNCEYPVMTFLVEARQKLHKDDKDFDINKSLETDLKFTDEEFKLAQKLMKNVVDGLYEDVISYRFFEGNGYVDSNTKIPSEILSKLKAMFPYMPGTYKETDYIKLNALTNKYKNRIFDTLRKYAGSLWS